MAVALQFYEAAEMVRELADDAEDVTNAYVTLCVHAGIAAADVRCAAALVRATATGSLRRGARRHSPRTWVVEGAGSLAAGAFSFGVGDCRCSRR